MRLETHSEAALVAIEEGWPDVVALSHYCWNTEISNFIFRWAKQHNPNVICIAGGPHLPMAADLCRDFLTARPQIDFYVSQEGERSFAELVSRILAGSETEKLKSERISGVMNINPQSGALLFGGVMPRLTNLDEIPSPYLSGLFDRFFDGNYFPFIESARGCPYAVHSARQHNGPIRYTASALHAVADLDFIAERAYHYPHLALAIADSNFGMKRMRISPRTSTHCRIDMVTTALMFLPQSST